LLVLRSFGGTDSQREGLRMTLKSLELMEAVAVGLFPAPDQKHVVFRVREGDRFGKKD
jgi:hypothetical protein